jgi:hypothetical protein
MVGINPEDELFVHLIETLFGIKLAIPCVILSCLDYLLKKQVLHKIAAKETHFLGRWDILFIRKTVNRVEEGFLVSKSARNVVHFSDELANKELGVIKLQSFKMQNKIGL